MIRFGKSGATERPTEFEAALARREVVVTRSARTAASLAGTRSALLRRLRRTPAPDVPTVRAVSRVSLMLVTPYLMASSAVLHREM